MKAAVQLVKFMASIILGERWNETITHSRQECKKLIESADKSIRIVTGDLQHELFEDDQIYSTFERLSKRKENPVKIEIIHGPHPDPKSKRIFELSRKNKARVKIMQLPKRPGAHFVLIDGTRYRLEKYHKAGQTERMAFMKTKNPIFLNRILNERFNDLMAVSNK